MRCADWLLVSMLCPVRRNVEYFYVTHKEIYKAPCSVLSFERLGLTSKGFKLCR